MFDLNDGLKKELYASWNIFKYKLFIIMYFHFECVYSCLLKVATSSEIILMKNIITLLSEKCMLVGFSSMSSNFTVIV